MRSTVPNKYLSLSETSRYTHEYLVGESNTLILLATAL